MTLIPLPSAHLDVNIEVVKMKRHGGKQRQFNKNNRNSKTNKFLRHGVQKKKAGGGNEVPRHIKNFKFSQRNKETEDALKRQAAIETKFRNRSESFKNRHLKKKLEEMCDEPEEDYYEKLVNSLQSSSKTEKAIENSDEETDSDEDMDEEEEDEAVDDQDLEDDLDGADSDVTLEEEESEDDEQEAINGNLAPEERKSRKESAALSTVEEEDELTEDEEDDDNEEEVLQDEDPYIKCYKYELKEDLVDYLQSDDLQSNYKKARNWPLMGKLLIDLPRLSDDDDSLDKNQKEKPAKNLLGPAKRFASLGQEPVLLSSKNISLDDLHINKVLQKSIGFSNRINKEKFTSKNFTALQWEFMSLLGRYQDLYLCNRSSQTAEELRFMYSLHALNHVMKSRTEVIKHNSLITKGEKNIEEAIRDQGLVRPKVLILAPLKDAGYRIVNMIIDLLIPEEKKAGRVINHKRFLDEFQGDELTFSKSNPKPDDYKETFQGNTDDNFRIGISLTKKCVKLYSDFYSSDLIIASPLGLRMIIGAPGDEDRDYDFLASLEMVIVDQMDVIYAQNWDHLLHIFNHMHLQPQSRDNTDFSRVRSWALNGWTKFYKQTVLISSFDLPEFRSVFNSHCMNYRGKVRQVVQVPIGSIRRCVVQIPQTFHRIDVSSIEGAFDARFKYFTTTILPQFTPATMAHCMIYIPSYFDFVRIRNYFKKEITTSCVQVCEYTKDGKVARARDMFYPSGAHFLLYTERSHFFRRPRVKGIRHLVFYQPPTWPHFYPEMVNLMQAANQNPRDGLEHHMTVTVLYTKYDIIQLSGILSTENAQEIVTNPKKTHLFVTEK